MSSGGDAGSNKQNVGDIGNLPSWDEFNMEDEQEELDYQEDIDGDEDSKVSEPNIAPEFGPVVPPGLAIEGGESQDGPSSSNFNNDFSFPNENDDEPDDPEDPQPCSSASTRRIIGPQIPSALLPAAINKNDEQFVLPSIATSFVDFDPQQNDAVASSAAVTIGPTLPPEFILPSNADSSLVNKPNEPAFDEIEDASITLPPDEPQCSSSSLTFSRNLVVVDRPPTSPQLQPIGPAMPLPSQERGPTLPDSSDDEDEGNRGGENGATNDNEVNESEDDDEELIGPVPPPANRTAEEEQADYFNRLAEFEAKQAQSSNGMKREEWMTELPQKMLKPDYGLTAKSSFSRASAGPSSSAAAAQIRDLWTATPNGVAQNSSNKKADPNEALELRRETEADKAEEERAKELNKTRNESLMDMHQRKRKLDSEGQSSSSSSVTRRPFDRDVDLQLRGSGTSMNSAEAAKDRLGALSNRFSHGNSRKFL